MQTDFPDDIFTVIMNLNGSRSFPAVSSPILLTRIEYVNVCLLFAGLFVICILLSVGRGLLR